MDGYRAASRGAGRAAGGQGRRVAQTSCYSYGYGYGYGYGYSYSYSYSYNSRLRRAIGDTTPTYV